MERPPAPPCVKCGTIHGLSFRNSFRRGIDPRRANAARYGAPGLHCRKCYNEAKAHWEDKRRQRERYRAAKRAARPPQGDRVPANDLAVRIAAVRAAKDAKGTSVGREFALLTKRELERALPS